MIGTMLVVESLHIDVPKGFIYIAMAFSLFVEFLNIKTNAKTALKLLKDSDYESKTTPVSSSFCNWLHIHAFNWQRPGR